MSDSNNERINESFIILFSLNVSTNYGLLSISHENQLGALYSSFSKGQF